MVRPPKNSLPDEDLEEDDEHYYGEDFPPRHDSSSQRGEAGKMDVKKGNTNTPRSKHSETEQRRRSKINERFQLLRDLIPQNDQKRDKASFLLEVIEYIHFLQEKLQMYEGAHQGYGQEPTKLTPWRNRNSSVGSQVEPGQVIRNGTSHENNDLVHPLMVTAQNSLQASSEHAAQLRSDMFASAERGGIARLAQEHNPDVGITASQSEPRLLPVPFVNIDAKPNDSQNGHKQLNVGNGFESLSSSYSQGLLYTLTQALETSGVDLSQASISVDINVSKRTEAVVVPSSIKDNGNHQGSCQPAAELHAGDRSYGDGTDHQPHKRPRTENS